MAEQALWQNRLCFKCLKEVSESHIAKTCTINKICTICKKGHNTLTHGYSSKLFKSNSIQTSQSISMCLVPVRVYHKDNEAVEVITYALLDENCQGTFVAESIIDALSVNTHKTLITTETINGSSTEKSSAVDGLVVKPLHEFEIEYGSTSVYLPTAYSR